MDWSDWIALGSALISLGVFCFSLWRYCKYDKPLKTVKKEILERELLAKKQASLKIDYYTECGNFMLRISNVGAACANNVSLKSLSKDPTFYNDGPSDEHEVGVLRPQATPQKIKIVYRRPKLTIEASWNDESAEGRKEIFELNCDARS